VERQDPAIGAASQETSPRSQTASHQPARRRTAMADREQEHGGESWPRCMTRRVCQLLIPRGSRKRKQTRITTRNWAGLVPLPCL